MSTVTYEAGSESIRAQKAVAQVVANRSRIRHKSICDVVHEPHQFSFVGKKPIKHMTKELRAIMHDVEVHPAVVGNDVIAFHDNSVHPKWKLTRVKKVGKLTFYK